MILVVFSVGLIFQTWLSQAHALQIPQSASSLSRQTSVSIDPNGQTIQIPGSLDLNINVGGSATANQQNPSGSIVRGIECGSTVQMYPGNSTQVFSTNFGVAHYKNKEACTWKFEANQCRLSAYCPCVDLPKSWECLGDYLKIKTDYVLENQRFCGGNKPGQLIYSDTDFLSVRFRSDGKNTGTGFICYIRCEGSQPIPMPPGIECPK